MKTFRFTLKPLQTLRERQEQVALQEYAQAFRALHGAQRRLAETEVALARICVLRRAALDRGTAAGELAQAQAFSQLLEQQKQHRAEQARFASQNSDRALRNWMAAKKASAVVERLRQLQWQGHLNERRKQEQKRLDDIRRLTAPGSAAAFP